MIKMEDESKKFLDTNEKPFEEGFYESRKPNADPLKGYLYMNKLGKWVFDFGISFYEVIEGYSKYYAPISKSDIVSEQEKVEEKSNGLKRLMNGKLWDDQEAQTRMILCLEEDLIQKKSSD